MHISLDKAAHLLQTGHVVAIPTETVYGLSASLNHPKAIEQIFTLKQRPANNPLIIHVENKAQLLKYVDHFPPKFNDLSDAFWPGPLTLILPIKPDVIPSMVCANLSTAAFRIPNHPMTLKLLKKTGPLVAPSANISGRPSATKPDHVEKDFGLLFPVLDGGACEKGLESTILMYQNEQWNIIRLGSLTAEILHPVLGQMPQFVTFNSKKQPLCPGQAYRHYAPQAKLFLAKNSDIPPNETLLGFQEKTYNSSSVYILGSLLNPEIVAENLYDILRQLDQDGIEKAWIDMEFPQEGLWRTIRERLEKASLSNDVFDDVV